MEKNKNIQSMNESDSWECKHCDFKELESGDYCKNGNELDGVFCNSCKNEFEHNEEKICSRFSDSVSPDIDFMALGLHGDHPRA